MKYIIKRELELGVYIYFVFFFLIFIFSPKITYAILRDPRGRPQIKSGTIYTENNYLLRGENPRLTDTSSIDDLFKRYLKYHLNTVRVLVYREPQNYNGGCGSDCNGLVRSIRDFKKENGDYDIQGYFDNIISPTIGYLNTWVAKAEQYGFYVIIDYHPVLGTDVEDVKIWWKYIAPLYKDKTYVLYELANEPNEGFSITSDADTGSYIETYNIIRNNAPDTPIILFSHPHFYNNEISKLINRASSLSSSGVDFTKTIIGVHMYWRKVDDSLGNDIQTVKSKFPLMNTEVGSMSDKSHGMDLIEMLDGALGGKNISWITLDGTENLPNNSEKRIPLDFVEWPKDPLTGLQGDVDGDSDVDIEDLSFLLLDFGKRGSFPTDFSNDGVIDINDLSLLLLNFGIST